MLFPEERVWSYHINKEIVKNNPVFNTEEIEQLFRSFEQLADTYFQIDLFEYIRALKLARLPGNPDRIKMWILQTLIDEGTRNIKFEPLLRHITNKYISLTAKEGLVLLFHQYSDEQTQVLQISKFIDIMEELGVVIDRSNIQGPISQDQFIAYFIP